MGVSVSLQQLGRAVSCSCRNVSRTGAPRRHNSAACWTRLRAAAGQTQTITLGLKAVSKLVGKNPQSYQAVTSLTLTSACLPRVFLWSPRDEITGNLPEDLNPALPSIFFLKLGSPSVYLDHSCPPWKYPRLPNDSWRVRANKLKGKLTPEPNKVEEAALIQKYWRHKSNGSCFFLSFVCWCTVNYSFIVRSL